MDGVRRRGGSRSNSRPSPFCLRSEIVASHPLLKMESTGNNGGGNVTGAGPFGIGGAPGVRAGEVGGGIQTNFGPQIFQQS